MDSAPSLGGPVAARKVVTALFCDVAGSTALGELLDAEVLQSVLSRLHQVDKLGVTGSSPVPPIEKPCTRLFVAQTGDDGKAVARNDRQSCEIVLRDERHSSAAVRMSKVLETRFFGRPGAGATGRLSSGPQVGALGVISTPQAA